MCEFFISERKNKDDNERCNRKQWAGKCDDIIPGNHSPNPSDYVIQTCIKLKMTQEEINAFKKMKQSRFINDKSKKCNSYNPANCRIR